ncbi:hypothetical protein NDU88_008422 [Pleurodeles waltl]|uniref:Secreted protein n=1 Tax=Pleurodeles waltl TaxID=8319 RepID=A0AAV7PPF6_PLEWA|nr:hypothetical protein NDU88_008422 [Pleurodeles waltl]
MITPLSACSLSVPPAVRAVAKKRSSSAARDVTQAGSGSRMMSHTSVTDKYDDDPSSNQRSGGARAAGGALRCWLHRRGQAVNWYRFRVLVD